MGVDHRVAVKSGGEHRIFCDFDSRPIPRGFCRTTFRWQLVAGVLGISHATAVFLLGPPSTSSVRSHLRMQSSSVAFPLGPPSTSSVLPQNVALSRLMPAAPRSLQLRVAVRDDSRAAITFRVSDDRSPASPASDDRWSGWERPAGVPEFRLRLM